MPGQKNIRSTLPETTQRSTTRYQQMSALKNAPSLNPGNLLPASLADRQLDHIERMVRSVARAYPAGPVHGMDQDYWESRLRALANESDLVAVQQHRVQRLLQDLARRAR